MLRSALPSETAPYRLEKIDAAYADSLWRLVSVQYCRFGCCQDGNDFLQQRLELHAGLLSKDFCRKPSRCLAFYAATYDRGEAARRAEERSQRRRWRHLVQPAVVIVPVQSRYDADRSAPQDLVRLPLTGQSVGAAPAKSAQTGCRMPAKFCRWSRGLRATRIGFHQMPQVTTTGSVVRDGPTATVIVFGKIDPSSANTLRPGRLVKVTTTAGAPSIVSKRSPSKVSVGL